MSVLSGQSSPADISFGSEILKNHFCLVHVIAANGMHVH